MDVNRKPASVVQRIYASTLDVVSTIGLILVIAAFALYVSGLLPGRMSPADTAAAWHLSAAELRARGDHEGRWGWMLPLTAGDRLSLASLALLASGSALCLLRIFVVLLVVRRRNLAVVTALEVAILALAASGILLAR